MSRLLRGLYRIAGRLPSPAKRALTGVRETRFLVGVLGVVLDEQGRVLLLKHTYRPFAPWGLPSGWLSAHESPSQAIAREIREEIGLSVETVRILDIRSAERPRRIDVWLECRSIGGVARSSAEVEEARFFERARLPPLIAEQEAFLRELGAR